MDPAAEKPAAEAAGDRGGPRRLDRGERGRAAEAAADAAGAAAVAARGDLLRLGPPAGWFVGKPSDRGVPWSLVGAGAQAPQVGLEHLAGEIGAIRLESLPGDNEAEFVEAGEGSQVGPGERISAPADGSVVHVEVFRAECVGALILGRPRPQTNHRRAESAAKWATPSSGKSRHTGVRNESVTTDR